MVWDMCVLRIQTPFAPHITCECLQVFPQNWIQSQSSFYPGCYIESCNRQCRLRYREDNGQVGCVRFDLSLWTQHKCCQAMSYTSSRCSSAPPLPCLLRTLPHITATLCTLYGNRTRHNNDTTLQAQPCRLNLTRAYLCFCSVAKTSL
jgi:hypothetical protein